MKQPARSWIWGGALVTMVAGCTMPPAEYASLSRTKTQNGCRHSANRSAGPLETTRRGSSAGRLAFRLGRMDLRSLRPVRSIKRSSENCWPAKCILDAQVYLCRRTCKSIRRLCKASNQPRLGSPLGDISTRTALPQSFQLGPAISTSGHHGQADAGRAASHRHADDALRRASRSSSPRTGSACRALRRLLKPVVRLQRRPSSQRRCCRSKRTKREHLKKSVENASVRLRISGLSH